MHLTSKDGGIIVGNQNWIMIFIIGSMLINALQMLLFSVIVLVATKSIPSQHVDAAAMIQWMAIAMGVISVMVVGVGIWLGSKLLKVLE